MLELCLANVIICLIIFFTKMSHIVIFSAIYLFPQPSQPLLRIFHFREARIGAILLIVSRGINIVLIFLRNLFCKQIEFLL